MATTRREIRRSIGNYRYRNKRLLEVYGTATGGTTTTAVLNELASYPSNTTEFDRMVVSVVSGTNVGYEGRITSFNQGTKTITFTPAAASAMDSTSVVEIWQADISAADVHAAMTRAIELIAEETVRPSTREWLAYIDGQSHYTLPDVFKYVHKVQVHEGAVVSDAATGTVISYTTVYPNGGASQMAVAQGFTVPTSDFYSGISVWIQTSGTPATWEFTTRLRESSSPTGGTLMDTATQTLTMRTTYGPTGPQLVYLKFSVPQYLATSTTYFFTISGGQTTPTTAVGVASGSSATGFYWTSNNIETVWTVSTTYSMPMYLIPYNDSWVDLFETEWAIEVLDRKGILSIKLGDRPLPGQFGQVRSVPTGAPIRVLGSQKIAGIASVTDTATIEAPRAFVEAKALEDVLLRLDPSLLEHAKFLAVASERELRNHVVKTMIPPGSRRVYYYDS